MTRWPALPLPTQPPAIVQRGWLPVVPDEQQLDVSIIIVHHNLLWAVLRTCLEALERGQGVLRCQVILVDHGLSAQLEDQVAAAFPWVAFIVDRSRPGLRRFQQPGSA